MGKSKLYQEFENCTDEIFKLGGLRSKEDLVTLIRITMGKKINIETIRKYLIEYEKPIKKKLNVLGYNTKEAKCQT